jgi:hypothetical protein
VSVRGRRSVLIVWVAVIVGLLALEVAEITHAFTLPVQAVLSDPLSFVLSLMFTTILALVGAIFIGIYISHRLLTPSGFTPFEQEMLRMRSELAEIRQSVEEIRASVRRPSPPGPPGPPRGPP